MHKKIGTNKVNIKRIIGYCTNMFKVTKKNPRR